MKRYRSTARGGFDENPDGAWVRYDDVKRMRENMMTLAEFQQQLGDAKGFRRALHRIGCTPGTVELLVREDRA